jgi:hypothetical protein
LVSTRFGARENVIEDWMIPASENVERTPSPFRSP